MKGNEIKIFLSVFINNSKERFVYEPNRRITRSRSRFIKKFEDFTWKKNDLLIDTIKGNELNKIVSSFMGRSEKTNKERFVCRPSRAVTRSRSRSTKKYLAKKKKARITKKSINNKTKTKPF